MGVQAFPSSHMSIEISITQVSENHKTTWVGFFFEFQVASYEKKEKKKVKFFFP